MCSAAKRAAGGREARITGRASLLRGARGGRRHNLSSMSGCSYHGGLTQGGAMKKQVVHTAKVPPARVPLSQAIKVGDWVFASGQLGLEVAAGKLVAGG